MGKDSQRIIVSSLEEMARQEDLGPPLHSLVIAAPKLHELEEDFLKQFRAEGGVPAS
jgi:diphthamide biosynthesis methyltransferase